MARFLRGPGPAVVTAARSVPGVTYGRPPAVTVAGLRRSGQTGNGESPRGRIAPARRTRPSRLTPVAGARQRAQYDPGRQAHGALRAPLKPVQKVVTGRTGASDSLTVRSSASPWPGSAQRDGANLGAYWARPERPLQKRSRIGGLR